MKKGYKKLTGMIGALGLVVLAGCGQDAAKDVSVTDDVKVPVTDPINPSAATEMKKEEAMAEGDVMKDKEKMAGGVSGTFDIEGAYIAPPGEEMIGISLTMENGVATAVEITPKGKHETSIKLQKSFAQSVSGEVIGKNLAELQTLDAVGGASLTTQGFKNALIQIKA